jgi:hypothetical protein
MSQFPSDPELGPIEAALGALSPARSRVDRDRLMFQAGSLDARASARRRWVWPSIAAALGLVAFSESIALAVRPAPQVIIAQQAQPAAESRPTAPAPEPVQILSQSPAAEPEEAGMWYAGGGESLALRRQVLRFGIDGLPELPPLLSQSDAPPTESPRTLRRDQLNKLLESGGPS